MSLPAPHQAIVDALIKDLKQAKPDDPLQYCSNYFSRQLELERALHRAGKSTSIANGKMADTAGPFNSRSPFATKNSIQEEDEERDTFGSPTDATFKARDSGRSPFGGSGFGAAAGAAAGGSLFGNWLGNQASEDTEPQAQSLPNNYAAGRRTSVSAESMQPDSDSGSWKPPKHSKTPEQYERLRHAVAGNFLFSSLDEESFNLVLAALVEKTIPAPNIKVITQGDEGDFFYVIESGEFDIYINPSGAVEAGPDGMGNKVATIGPGGSFGELALMYNAPRAATVVSSSKGGLLWALDRVTFRRILMNNAFQKREMYEGFLGEVPLLSSLKPYERAKIADALETVKYESGQNIITEGEPGDAFYLLESGHAVAYKHGVDHPVKEYGRGDFFGELALLDDKPRAASVVAKDNVTVAKLGRDGFKRLLGPVESIMRREEYENAEEMDPLTQQKTVT
ncbi:cAMP-dependent protein kinase regulator [Cladophialophora psammophila CBS 110553]|uniref:cAMP-dependent protein kinase regulatory subunit n=1 Tax=Cladophialophora psammophila CBS 110553 TaxID=1182543 RepID=W9X8C0_9EURO|nr:cAMP-dependent protein kinase regulator [Cladophialophora psammophila CBS 110553]EXJ73575.1 cAMP-dependent protein kinase regulator [Cladophialophora psammophila CBS 110553]